jgi:hypothetical protein
MAYTLKAGVVGNPQPELAAALDVAGDVYASFGQALVVTSLGEGEHMVGSLHPRGYAADLRTSTLGVNQAAILGELKGRLGPAYDVILEADHIHVEYDPGHDGGANLPDFSPSAPGQAWPPIDTGGGLDPGAIFAPAGGADTSGAVLLGNVPTGLYWGVGGVFAGLVLWLAFRD